MQFEIETTEEKLKRHFKRDYKNLALLCLIMYTIIIITLCSGLLKNYFFLIFKYYLVGLIILSIFLFLLTRITIKISMYMLKHVVNYKYGIFKEIIDEKGLTEIIDDDAVVLNFSDVSKIIKAHNFIVVKPKNRKHPSFLYKKTYFKTIEEYERVVDTIEKYYKKAIQKGVVK